MFPSKVDLTKDECRGALRRLELEAYSSVVSTFRAQGNLDSNKQTVLDQLRRFFKISEDRHKAEIRRVANNEKLTTISELTNGKSFDLEWTKEGHRSYPLISRAPSCTALHILADHASKVAAFDNTELLTPSETRRERNLDVEILGRQIITDDPTKPPQISSPAAFGISKKDLKRNIDLVTLHPHTKKKHYHHLKPPPPAPHMKIQHLYQTLNTKRPRKTFTKKSKTKATKQSPSSSGSGRMQYSYATHSSPDEKHFDGAELQRHLTSQLMPPPPMKLAGYTQKLPTTKEMHLEAATAAYTQPLPTSRKEMNLLKMNHHQQHSLEPQAHYIPNNRLKNELLSDQHHHHHQQSPVRARSGRSKSMSVSSKSNYNAKYANGAGSRINSSSSMDHIPDPQIIFNTTSSLSKMDSSSSLDSIPLESSDMSPVITSPLQLLSTAASCTPKLKVTSPINHHHQHHLSSSLPSSSSHQTHLNIQIQQQQQSTNVAAQLPPSPSSSSSSSITTSSLSITPPATNALKTVQNRAIKIIPANTKPMIIKPQNAEISKSPQQQTLISTAPSKFKIQKIQLVMNKNQDGSSTNISPSATIVSGKAGQLVLSGKGITNYHVGSKATPYTILSSSATKVGGGGPKVIVQTIDRSFAQAQKDGAEGEKIPDNQRITENTPIDFLPVNTNSTTTASASSFPKVIIQKSGTAPKQIKLKLGPGSIVNSKIIKGQLPGNLKIQRNINTKGFTVLNTSQIVQIQSNTAAIAAAAAAATSTSNNAPPPIAQQPPVVVISNNNESTKTDWEQELDDANRTKVNSNKDRTTTESNGNSSSSGGSVAKKPRLDETQVPTESNEEVVQNNNDDNIIIETSEIESNSTNNLIYAESLPQIDAVTKVQETISPETPISEFVYISTESDLKPTAADISSSSSSSVNPVQEIIFNGEGDSTKLNGQFEEIMQVVEEDDEEDDRPHNGAEAYENLVKSLEAECESDYMKEITGEEEDSQIDENFRLIDSSNMLDPSIAFSRETERIFQ